jgi:hypothetical protein
MILPRFTMIKRYPGVVAESALKRPLADETTWAVRHPAVFGSQRLGVVGGSYAGASQWASPPLPSKRRFD